MIISEGNGGSQPSGWKAKDGKLWFPMLLGGIIIDPKLKSTNKPSVLVEEITLENEKLNTNKPIVIPYDQGNLEIQYTALSFSKAKQTRFFYKMEGLDEDWIDAGFRREVIYPYLPSGLIIVSDINSGLYIFQPNYVRACYLEGFVTDVTNNNPINGATITITNTITTESSNVFGEYKTGIATAGSYTITATAPGYTTASVTLSLVNGQVTNQNFQLVPLVPFTVSAKSCSSQTTSNSIFKYGFAA